MPQAFHLTNPCHSLLSYIILLGNKPLSFFTCTTLILDLSFSLHIVSLLYNRTGMSITSWSTLTHLSYRLLALTRDLMAPATFLTLTTFLQYLATSVPDLSKTNLKYLNYDTCYNQALLKLYICIKIIIYLFIKLHLLPLPWGGHTCPDNELQ